MQMEKLALALLPTMPGSESQCSGLAVIDGGDNISRNRFRIAHLCMFSPLNE